VFHQFSETIAAISSASGSADRGIVRLSGEDAWPVAATLFREDSAVPKNKLSLAMPTTATCLRGFVAIDDDTFVIPAELYAFAGPRSYTGQNVIELHTVGSNAVLDGLVRRAVAHGARHAAPGEFTARAFCNGRMDLSQVQAVAGLIHAKSDAQARIATAWLEGHLGKKIRAIREELIQCTALVEADIDFSEEPIDFIDPQQLRSNLHRWIHQLNDLVHESESHLRVDGLPSIVLVGAPNVGKSTMINRLCGGERAISSPTSGSTRDLLKATVQLPNGVVEVFDSPGLGFNSPQIEKKTKNFVRREMTRAALVCVITDVVDDHPDVGLIRQFCAVETPILWVANKADLALPKERDQRVRMLSAMVQKTVLTVSARTGAGISALIAQMDDLIFVSSKTIGNQSVAISEIQSDGLKQASEALLRAAKWCETSEAMIDTADYVATDLRNAVDALGLLFGEVTSEDLLDRIFRDFCIGK
jgi:tRNA modification GTPase